MRLGGKLEEWRAAGLTDAATLDAIRAYEARDQHGVGWFAVAGLGVLAVSLGVMSLVAANWDQLSDGIKLAAHLLLLTAAAAGVEWFRRTGRVWAGEGALFLLAALVLAGIALHAQVYQQSGPLWQALAWWAALSAPAILLLGRTRLTAIGLGAMLIALAASYGLDGGDWLGETLSASLPPALVFAALALPGREADDTFRAGLFGMGITLTLLVVSLAHIGWVFDVTARDAASVWERAAAPACFVAGACWLARRDQPPAEARLIMVVLAGGLAAVLIALGLPHPEGPGSRFLGVLSFLAFWGGTALLALRAGWLRLFRLGVAAIAARLLIVYFELFYSLAFTGIGLIVAGLLTLGLAWGWTRIVRRTGHG